MDEHLGGRHSSVMQRDTSLLCVEHVWWAMEWSAASYLVEVGLRDEEAVVEAVCHGKRHDYFVSSTPTSVWPWSGLLLPTLSR